jgi:hypothetical protein
MESTNSYKNGIPQFDGQKYVFLEHKDEGIYTGTGISSLAINCRWTQHQQFHQQMTK